MKEISNRPGGRERLLSITTTHGKTGTPEYQSWLRMKARCYQLSSPSYPNYGGRGIIVCDRWLEDFVVFLEDMGQKPEPDYTLDRIDVNAGYFKENCRWTPQPQQGREHKRSLKPIEVAGVLFPSFAAACQHYGFVPPTVRYRLKIGQSIEEAFELRPSVLGVDTENGK